MLRRSLSTHAGGKPETAAVDPSLFTELPRQKWQEPNVTYYGYVCSQCGKEARNTYYEPSRSQMLEHRLCFSCNHWREFDEDLAKNHSRKTIIGGAIYTPGNRTTGPMRGMAGRRFDIEYMTPSDFAGKRVTTFDLWTGGAMPDWLREKYPDTAKFLNGAERCQVGETGCWNPSDNKAEPYPLPKTAGIS